ncbi:sporulation integral membrane protein YtvI [Paenibacillus guangzhouensis]|uniref:sporulation integral membrane protein YtvI n=1 Tax=Paenibacillus guangzhouensis TaxID=1473112 RepID=UPI0012674797|nr:sporulation integral membrane protein YtvI [Paenibacillus guangzhouensis]
MQIKQLILILLGLAFLYGLFTVGAPFLLAFICAMLLEPINGLLMRRLKMKRIVASSITCTLFMLIFLSTIYLLGVQVLEQSMNFLTNAPAYFEGVQAYILKLIEEGQGFLDTMSPDIANSVIGMLSNLSDSISGVVNKLSQILLSFASGIPGLFFFFLFFIVALYLFCFNMDTMRRSMLTLFEDRSRDQVNEVLNSLKNSVFGFIRAQIIFSAFTYITTFIGLLILGVKYPLAIALLVTIVDILPILGVGSALVPWGVYCLLTGDIFTGLGLIVLFLVITVLRRIIEPKILGDAVGIGSLSALISLYVGMQLAGAIGLFLGPLVVIVYSAMRKAGLFQIKIKFE